jgi:hypothetical protein
VLKLKKKSGAKGLNLISGTSMNMCGDNPNLVKIGKNYVHF